MTSAFRSRVFATWPTVAKRGYERVAFAAPILGGRNVVSRSHHECVSECVSARRRGTGSFEYALLIALIAIVAIAGVTAAGLVNTIFQTITTKLP